MAVVIGSATTVTFFGSSAYCIASANWGYNPNTQRLYCIGSWTPTAQYDRPQETMSFTMYSTGTGGPTFSVIPSTGCDANLAVDKTVEASINPASCGAGAPGGFSGRWYVTGYNFSKDDPLLPGQESWSMQRWVASATVPAPNYVIRGIAEGQGTSNAGIVFTGTTTSTQTGSVSAGGVGRAESITVGVISQVGGGSIVSGETGQGSSSMPHTPLWV